MLTVTSKCYLHIIFISTAVNFPKKAHKLEINKKKSREACEKKSRKSDIGMKNARHEIPGACKAREHMIYEST